MSSVLPHESGKDLQWSPPELAKSASLACSSCLRSRLVTCQEMIRLVGSGVAEMISVTVAMTSGRVRVSIRRPYQPRVFRHNEASCDGKIRGAQFQPWAVRKEGDTGHPKLEGDWGTLTVSVAHSRHGDGNGDGKSEETKVVFIQRLQGTRVGLTE
jgi:hypothetical protein